VLALHIGRDANHARPYIPTLPSGAGKEDRMSFTFKLQQSSLTASRPP
jgi:hypothetical protein